MPEVMKVQATVPEKKDANGVVTQKQIGPYTIEVQAGATGAESIAMFGDEAVNSNALSNWTVTIQANMRSGMKKGETQEQLQARLGNAKMGVAAKGAVIDPVQSFIALYASSTPEKQKELLGQLQSRAAKK